MKQIAYVLNEFLKQNNTTYCNIATEQEAADIYQDFGLTYDLDPRYFVEYDSQDDYHQKFHRYPYGPSKGKAIPHNTLTDRICLRFGLGTPGAIFGASPALHLRANAFALQKFFHETLGLDVQKELGDTYE